MKSFAQHPVFVGLTVFVSVLLKTWALASLEYELREGLMLDWYFENADPTWQDSDAAGYFHDYNGDGLPDYLIHQSNNTNQDRIFCLDTAHSEVPKTYENNRTASRVIDWQPGTFIPDDMYLKKKISEKRTPDIILVGKDAQTGYTKFVFWRLDETDSSFPTETPTWSINVDAQDNPTLIWPEWDVNGDDYPDFLVYNALPNLAGIFTLRCFNGLNGAELWKTDMAKAGDDGRTSSALTVQVLPMLPEMNVTGDFDGDEIAEILVFYSYSYGSFLLPPFAFGVKGKITVLRANGLHLSSYPGWWDVYDYPNSFVASVGSAVYDFNKDTYVDMQLTGYVPSEDIPVLRVIDLMAQSDLFETLNTDFGADQADWTGFIPMPVRRITGGAPSDLDGDSWWDLVFYNATGIGEQGPHFGAFNAYAGGVAATRGRKMWLADGSPYDSVQYLANDWNGDDLIDFALVKNPEAPSNGMIGWNFGLKNIGVSGPILQKTFDTSIPYAGPFNANNDDFSAWTLMLSSVGDVDGDGLQDTYASHFCEFDYGKNSGVKNVDNQDRLGYVILSKIGKLTRNPGPF
jgi:hypothetical protein